ncbi:MAG: 3-deoxy-manno-octulosonate cytidylyltransferase (CMP-KDO synthetase) [Saprospiraceae bacterium]|jgi:3-deoxy-manno-octulosonate cytidylyltransferase (CMP-KDO synthetase)
MQTTNKVLGIIPARYDSSRFPGKVLVDIAGKSMIQRVYEQAKKATSLTEVVVATDDERIFQAVEAFGGQTVFTDKNHQSGTDRCAEVLKFDHFQNFDIVINIQGDEPFIQPEQIDKAVLFLQKNTAFNIATLAKKIKETQALFSPNVVKVVFGNAQNALYFSRNAIPYLRDEQLGNWLQKAEFYKHIGLYAFRKNTLEAIAKLPVGRLENWEKLEQLRWLENGCSIGVEITELETIGIDTPEDLALAIKNLS